MLRKLLSPWRPAVYHGFGRTKAFFEGWYFKAVSADGRSRYAVIPGVSLAERPEESHAFIQVLDGLSRSSDYFRFPLSEFEADRRRFDVRIGRSRFRLEGITLDAASGGRFIRGGLAFDGIRPWPVRLFSPGAMGWYAFAPAMECSHGVLGFNHRLEGRLTVNGREADFGGGKGYIEKDWGRSMPRAWVWAQSNHFDEEDASLSLSLGTVPWRRRWFSGQLAGFWLRGRLFPFATYTGSKVARFEVSPDEIFVVFDDGRHALDVRARRAEGAPLASPVQGAMEGRLTETMDSEAEVVLRSGRGPARRTVFQGRGRFACLEVVGDMDELKSGIK